ncbi:MAG: mannose-1-phosphate guanylyltransferase [Planctomycetota bacterium]
MRHALIIAGGSGTRLWPMSVKSLPKQLIPFIGGRSLLQIAMDRLEGLVPDERIHVCAGESTRDVMLDKLPRLAPDRFIAEPTGRDTLNAVALAAHAIAHADPDAVIAVFTADHLIEPVDKFQKIVTQGFELAERDEPTLVTFGVQPTHAATGFGYLQLGEPIGGHGRVVDQFKEKPDADTAQAYLDAGPEKYLWNSGMFVWKASTLSACCGKFAPENHAGLQRIAKAWGTADQDEVLGSVFPDLKKISVDFAVMEPASADEAFTVAAVPMDLTWLDVGSWPAFAETLDPDAAGNAVSAGKAVLIDAANNLVASDDPDHAVTVLGCADLIVIHTEQATMVCHKDKAQDIKKLHAEVREQLGDDYV